MSNYPLHVDRTGRKQNRKRRASYQNRRLFFEYLESRRVLHGLNAVDDTFSGVEDTPLTLSASALMSNDDLGDEPTSITAFDALTTQGGTVVDNGDSTYTYTPPSAYLGPDTFTYTITDSHPEISTATVTVNVNEAFTDQLVVGGLNAPIGLISLPDGRMLIGEKAGVVKIVDPSDPVPTTQTYLTIPNVETANERGLWDFALDPDFATNNYFYVYYASSETDKVRVSRFEHDTTLPIDAGTETVIWEDPDTYLPITQTCCHYGGGMDFGPDGKLYLTTGDKWKSPADSQDLESAAGKIIRLNSDGTIPGDNPFVDGPGGNLDEIWAYGLRNPFRANWDLPTGRFFIGDVGGNVQETAKEEINLGIAGANYGWNNVEGIVNNPLYEDPIFEYDHSAPTPDGGAIAGGFVYRGTQFPSEYDGAYFFGDYVAGWIRYLKFDTNGDIIDADPGTQAIDPFDFVETPIAPVAIEQGADGALYYNDYIGELHKVEFNNGNLPPVITSATANPTQGDPAPLQVNFAGTATDPESGPLTYTWDFGDGNQATGQNATHDYLAKGYYLATLQVSDGIKTTVSDPIPITVGQAPVIQSISPADGTLFRGGDVLNLSAVVTDDGPLTGANYSWTARFIHNAHTHPEFDNISGETTTLNIPTTGHDFSDMTGFEIELTVTDNDGIPTTEVISVFPDKVDVTFSTNFPGTLTYQLDSIPRVGNFVHDTAIDFQHTISVPDVVYNNGNQFVFSQWSDGTQTSSNTFTVPDSNLLLTAEYTNNGPAQLITNDLVLRLDAQTGVSTIGTTVTGWNDQSGLNNDLNAVGNPQLVAGGLNGHDIIDFDGVDDRLVRTATLNGLPGGNSDRTVLFVTAYDGVGFGGFAYGENTLNQAFGTTVSPGGFLSVQAWGVNNDFISSTAGTGAGWIIQSVVLDANQMTHYKDGDLIDARTHTYNTDVNNGEIAVGVELDGAPRVDLGVAEILVYDVALTPAELEQVEAYLAGKYFSANQQPVAVDDTDSTLEDTPVTIAVLANDILGDPPTTITNVTQGSDGTVTTNGTTVSYAPNTGFTGSDTFTYTITDNDNETSTASVMVTVTASGGSGAPLNPVLDLQSDSGVTLNGGFVDQWQDLSGNANHVSATGATRPEYGSVTTPSGQTAVSFDGANDHLLRTVPEGFTGLPVGNAGRTVFLVAQINDANWSGGAAYGAGAQNQTFGVGVVGRGSNEGRVLLQGWGGANDLNANVLAYTPPTGPTTGWTILTAVHQDDGTNPADNAFLYKDGAQVAAWSHQYNTNLSNAALLNGNESISRIVLGQEISENGHIRFDVAAYVVYDSALNTADMQTVESFLTNKYLGAGNNTPNAVDDTSSTLEDTPVTINVLANDALGDPPTTITNVTQGSDGTVTTNGTTVSYAPNTGFTGSDTFTYTITDNDNETSTASVMVTVTASGGSGAPLNPVLDLQSDSGVTLNGGFVDQWQDLSGNANHVSATGGTRPEYGSVTTPSGQTAVSFDGANDHLLRTVPEGFTGLPVGNAGRTVFLVAQINDANWSGGAAYGAGAQNQTFGVGVVGRRSNEGKVLLQGYGNSNDLSANVLAYTPPTGPTTGWTILTAVHQDDGTNPADNAFLYKDGAQVAAWSHQYNTNLSNAALLNGNDSISRIVLGQEISENGHIRFDVAAYVVYDSALNTADMQTVESFLTNKYLGAGNNTPNAVDDTSSTLEDTQVTINVLANDALGDPPTTITNVTQGSDGTVTTNGTTVSYAPNTGFTGSDTFTYTITDNDNETSTASVMVTVTASGGSGAPLNPVLDLQSDSGVTLNGGFVDQWQDLSGNANHVSATGGTRPEYGSVTTPSGQTAVSFDGANDHLLRTVPEGFTGLPVGNAGRTVFLVAQINDANWSGGAAYGAGAQNQTFGVGVVGRRSNEGKVLLQGWGGANDLSANVLAYTPPTGPTTGWTILTAVHQDDGTNPADNAFLYKDGAQVAAWSHQYNTNLSNAALLNGNDSISRIVLGEEISENGYIRFDVAAYVVYDSALSTADMQTVESFLTNKYLSGAVGFSAPYQNPRNSYDVDDDGFVAAPDALEIVSFINTEDSGWLPSPPVGDSVLPPYLDPTGDNWAAADDVLAVVAALNGLADGNSQENLEDPDRVALAFAVTGFDGSGDESAIDRSDPDDSLDSRHSSQNDTVAPQFLPAIPGQRSVTLDEAYRSPSFDSLLEDLAAESLTDTDENSLFDQALCESIPTGLDRGDFSPHSRNRLTSMNDYTL